MKPRLVPSPSPLHEGGAGLSPSPEASSRFRASRLLTVGLTTWVLLVLLVYYRQLFEAGLRMEGVGYPDIGQSLLQTGLPHWREALWRAVGGIGSAALVIAAAVGAGRLTLRWLLPADAACAERWVLTYANGAGVLAYALLALAVAGLYRPVIVRVVIAAFVLGGIATLGHRALPGIIQARGALARLRRNVGAGGAELPWMLITVAAVFLAALCALAPETEFDALWYHLELPRRWLAAGRPVDDLTEYISLYPLTWELLFGAALAFDGSVAARLVHWSTLPAAAAAVALFGGRVMPSASPWLTAAIFVTPPTVFWEATTTYVDLAMTLHAGLGVYALVRAGHARDRGWLTVAALHLGLAGATKHLALVVTAVALGAFVLWHAKGGLSRAIRSAALVGAVALVVASPWYLRAWHASGNPVFPEMYHVFGARPAHRWDHLTQAGLERFKDRFGPRSTQQLVVLPWDVTMHGTRYGGTFGPLLLATLPAALIVAARVRLARWLLAGAAAYLAVWASPLSSYQLRFLIPLWWITAPLVAAALQLLVHSAGAVHRVLRTVGLLIVAAVLLVNLPPWTVLHEGDRHGWTGWLTHIVREWPMQVVLGGISEEAYLARHVRTYGAWRWIDAHTPPRDTRVLTFLGGDHFYAERRRIWSEAVTARDATWGALTGQEAEARAAMARLGITHVMAPVPARQSEEQQRLAALQPGFIASHGEVVYEDGWTLVYRLGPSPEAAVTDQR